MPLGTGITDKYQNKILSYSVVIKRTKECYKYTFLQNYSLQEN